jgi:LPXTG-site transpeptidase (sortase) family protein
MAYFYKLKIRVFIGVAALAILSSCRPSLPPSPTSTLLPPVVKIIKSTAAPIPQTRQTPTMEATREPQTLLEMARSVYGSRLVESIRIPAINLWAPVTPVGWLAGGDPADPASTDWDSPNAQVGWMVNGALPDDISGNIILYGHNNIDSSVFLNLYKLKAGDGITLQTGNGELAYRVFEVTILPVQNKAEDLAAYKAYLGQSSDLRLTLISCYPPVSNTERVVVIAFPANK